MKRRARSQGKGKLDLRDPKRRASTAWVKTYMKKYTDTVIGPLVARISLVEGVLAENGIAVAEDGKVYIVDVKVREYLNQRDLTIGGQGPHFPLPIAQPANGEANDAGGIVEGNAGSSSEDVAA